MEFLSDLITLSHGNGGRRSHELISSVMKTAFDNPILAEGHDAARFSVGTAKLAFTTDSFVVKPLFFSGGDIGRLAVCGTVNDLAVSGADPLYLSAGFVIEEGFSLSTLKTIVGSMAATAKEAGVSIVTGDTKVVEKGAVDGLFINTAGVGQMRESVSIDPQNVRAGQTVIISGTLGDHAIAVMRERHGIELPAGLCSDCAPLNKLIADLLCDVPQVVMLRDPTRGGIATTLNEIALQASVGILLDEDSIPVNPAVRTACDILGYDPLYLANEGKFVLIVETSYSDSALAAVKRHPLGREARIIGKVTTERPGLVGLRTTIGGIRLLDMLVEDQLPRIC